MSTAKKYYQSIYRKIENLQVADLITFLTNSKIGFELRDTKGSHIHLTKDGYLLTIKKNSENVPRYLIDQVIDALEYFDIKEENL